MPRRSASTGLTIGFIGSGQIDQEASENLIIDFLEANSKEGEDITFILPIVDQDFSQTLADVCDLAKENEIPYVAVIDVPGSAAPKSIKKYIDEASKSHKVEDVDAQVLKLLGAAPRPHLFVLFDGTDQDYDDELIGLAEEAFEADIKVFDLTDSLAALQPEGEGESEPEAPAEPEPEPEAPAPRRRRSSTKAEPEPEPEREATEEANGADPNELLGLITKAIAKVFDEYFGDVPAAEPEPERAPRRRRTTAAAAEPEPEAEAPRRSRGRPRKDGTPAQPRTTTTTGRRVRSS